MYWSVHICILINICKKKNSPMVCTLTLWFRWVDEGGLYVLLIVQVFLQPTANMLNMWHKVLIAHLHYQDTHIYFPGVVYMEKGRQSVQFGVAIDDLETCSSSTNFGSVTLTLGTYSMFCGYFDRFTDSWSQEGCQVIVLLMVQTYIPCFVDILTILMHDLKLAACKLHVFNFSQPWKVLKFEMLLVWKSVELFIIHWMFWNFNL